MAWVAVAEVNAVLREHHYLGPVRAGGFAWADSAGVMVFGAPRSRRLPLDWLELSRWCIVSRERNAGSRQWKAVVRELRARNPGVTTVISYSDCGHGHDGALYRACNWWWAPTWLRLRPPPSGNGAWTLGCAQGVKDRWVYPLRPDARRVSVLVAKDAAILKKRPQFTYREPNGADYALWRALGNV